MIAYKVVRNDHGILKSYLSRALGPAETIYGVNHRTKRNPGCGPLATFDTLEHAKEFVDNDNPVEEYRKTLRIYRCRIKVSHATNLWDKNGIRGGCLKPGTVLADTVTLLEEVHSYA